MRIPAVPRFDIRFFEKRPIRGNADMRGVPVCDAPPLLCGARPDRMPPQSSRAKMFQDTTDLAAMAEALARSPDYRILRRLVARPTYVPTLGQEDRTGVLLDTETTGLDHAKDEIIELGMVKFDYSADGRIVGVRDTFSAFNEPSVPISAEVTAFTGITDEMVAGHRLDDAAVTDFVGDSVVTIAHNSGFDRRFVEHYWPVFASLRGCPRASRCMLGRAHIGS